IGIIATRRSKSKLSSAISNFSGMSPAGGKSGSSAVAATAKPAVRMQSANPRRRVAVRMETSGSDDTNRATAGTHKRDTQKGHTKGTHKRDTQKSATRRLEAAGADETDTRWPRGGQDPCGPVDASGSSR